MQKLKSEGETPVNCSSCSAIMVRISEPVKRLVIKCQSCGLIQVVRTKTTEVVVIEVKNA